MNDPTAASVKRLALLRKLKKTKQARLGSKPSISRRNLSVAELSFGQQRLWFLDRFEPGNPRFNIMTAMRLRGRTSLQVLEPALNEIIRRHEIWRTVFLEGESGPVQKILPRLDLRIQRVDLDAVAGPQREKILQRFLVEETRRSFDLDRGPLTRGFLLRLAPAEHVLVLTQHQIIVDRWSRGLFVREMVALYQAMRQGRPSPLEELAFQYADFAAWQREDLTGEKLRGLLDHWTEQLEPVPPPLELPTDRPRPAVSSHRGSNRYFVIPKAAMEPVSAFCRTEGRTLFMVLLASYAALLHRYTGQTDLVLGSPIANRTRGEIQELLGFFLNMISLRLRPTGDLSFRELLTQARITALDAYAHQELPFEKLVDELNVERDLSRHPLFQSTLVLQNAPLPSAQVQGLEVELVEADWATTAFDLTLFFWETALFESLEEGLTLTVSYSTDLFDGATIHRLQGHLRNLIQGAVRHPERRLSDLALLSAPECHQMVTEWSGFPQAPLGPEETVDRIFEHWAARVPDRIAAELGDQMISYGELDRRAEALADLLRTMTSPEEVVATYLDRSATALVAFLGILKAGASYLPLQLEDPPARLVAELRSTRVSLLLTESRHGSALPESSAFVVLLDKEWKAGGLTEAVESAPYRWRSQGDSVAAIFPTSGTSGEPKAVEIVHGAIVRMARDTEAFRPEQDDRVGHAASLGFDASLFEIWGSLLNGSRLRGLRKEDLLAPRKLRDLLETYQVTSLFLTAPLLEELITAEPAALGSLDRLLFGGDVTRPETIRRIQRSGAPSNMIHVYGPTEATTFSSYHPVRSIAEGTTHLPIGRATSEARIHLLDSHLRPVPSGSHGRIFVGGRGLARGYHGSPRNSAARFLPDPFSPLPGQRLYWTGDHGRFLPDGTIEFCGRMDRQIKLRGHRIELEEVELALRSLAGVRQASVDFHPGQHPRDERLVAHVVPQPGASPSPEELKVGLKQKLPAYMVPALIDYRDQIPLTPRGKLDRQTLLTTGTTVHLDPSPEPEGLRSFIKEPLIEIWSETLGTKRLGPYDNFFEHGGHSLHVVQIVSRLRERWGIDIPVRALFEFPTVSQLAVVIRDRLEP